MWSERSIVNIYDTFTKKNHFQDNNEIRERERERERTVRKKK